MVSEKAELQEKAAKELEQLRSALEREQANATAFFFSQAELERKVHIFPCF